MRVPREALLLGIGALVAGCAAGPEKMSEPGPAAVYFPPAECALEDRLQAVRASLDAVQRDSTDFAGTARRLHAIRDAMFRIMKEVPDADRRRDAGIENLALRVETERRALLQERLPEEAYRWLRAAADAKAREPAPDGTLVAARQYFFRQAERDLLDHLTRASVPEAESAELDALLRADPAGLTEEETGRVARFVQMRKMLRVELQDFWRDRDRAVTCTTSYGSGTFLVVASADGPDGGAPTPEQWWEAAPPEARAGWLLSISAERGLGSLLDVLRIWDELCEPCGGAGRTQVDDPSPGTRRFVICPSCSGGGAIRKVRWR